MDIELARFNMIEQQIRPWEVFDADVLSLLAAVRREDFVPPVYRAMAFVDTEIPLHTSQGPAQSMLAPKVEARLLQELDVGKHERVLEVGAGSGFMAALLGHQAQQVLSLEIDAELAAFATANLRRAGASNVTVRHADGSRGCAAEGPFDVIVLSGSVPQVPPVFFEQLKPGGRLVAIVGQLPIMRAVLYTRSTGDNGDTGSAELFDTVAPRLTGFDEPSRFHF
ncbi:MAG: protein-L-isoaspartate O-methyltransferase [Pseudomonadota bacterium]|nr:protein-L-isoaspartate O-methyltransferase [Pseudomonadota bacterium]